MSVKYAVVFDMDETLGHFPQLYRFWNLLTVYLNNEELESKYFYNIIDTFPLFLRPKILSILKNIKKKKRANICNYVMIYTNNNGPIYWANLIKSYFHYKLNYNLFDQIIKAFKVEDEIVELCRTSHNKSFTDFINCTKLPTNTKICFLDDSLHKEMNHENVLYINIEPYYYNISFKLLADKFYDKNKNLFSKSKAHFINYIILNTNNYKLSHLNKSSTKKNIDLLLSYQIIKEINKFFKNIPKTTKKKRKKIKKNITQKS